MPEMPEVETMVDRLQKYVGKTITQIDVEKNERYLQPDDINQLLGQRINGVFRRAKFMIFMLDRGAMVCHNAMSGYWDSTDEPWTFDYVEGDRTPGESDVRAKIIICNPELPLITAQTLRFHDARKFGQLRYLDPGALAVKLSTLGPEITTSKHLYEPSTIMTDEMFIDTFRKVKQPIKAALMDQNRVSGLGNIYAAEACWAALIDPRRPARELSVDELETLRMCGAVVLNDALDRRLDYSGLSIYRRKSCSVCGSPVSVEDLKGRSTYWCPKCQR